jgi:uncharacterized protein
VSNDLDKPLGTSLVPKKTASLTKGGIFTAFFVCVTVGASVFLALQPIAYFTPAKPVSETTKPVAQLESTDPIMAQDPYQENTDSGAKIITFSPSSHATMGISVKDPMNKTQALSVAHIPDRDLIAETAQGRLPIRAKDGRRPLDVYARPWSGKRGARVAIVISGMGVSQTATQLAIDKLPPQITLGFAPQGNSLSRWAQSARRKGHEILLQIPMEPFDYPRVDPGRGTLLSKAGLDENQKVLHESMARLTNYTGVMNYLGAKFTSEPTSLEPIMSEITARGLLYLDDGSSARSKADMLAATNKTPFASADLTIDLIQNKNDILKELDKAEQIARSKGFAIAVGTGFEVTINAVKQWTNEAEKRGIEIVGVSALAK